MANDFLSRFDHFHLHVTQRDQKPIVSQLNAVMGIFPVTTSFPWLVEVELPMASSDSAGLPTDEAKIWLDEIEVELHQHVFGADSIFIARQTGDGRRKLDFYVQNADTTRDKLAAWQQSSDAAVGIVARFSEDPEWTTWIPMLRQVAGTLESWDDVDLEEYESDYSQSVQLRIDRGDEESEAIEALCAALDTAIDRDSNGALHSMIVEAGNVTLVIHGDDARSIYASILPILRETPMTQGAEVTLRFGRDDEEFAEEETFVV